METSKTLTHLIYIYIQAKVYEHEHSEKWMIVRVNEQDGKSNDNMVALELLEGLLVFNCMA